MVKKKKLEEERRWRVLDKETSDLVLSTTWRLGAYKHRPTSPAARGVLAHRKQTVEEEATVE